MISSAYTGHLHTASGIVLLVVASALTKQLSEAAEITATWTGGGGDTSFNAPANWDIGQVPLNNMTDEFVVVIPTSQTVNFDVPGSGHQVFQLSLAGGATLNINPGRELTVVDEASVAGVISTDNGTYAGNSLASTITGNAARVLAQGGGSVSVGGTSFTNTTLAAGDLIVAQGPGSKADLSSVLTINTDADFGGTPTRRIFATDGGLVDLSAVTNIVGGRGGDTLQFQFTNGGQIQLDSLNTISGARNVRFTSDGTTIALPALQTIESAVLFELANGQTLSLPQLQSIDGAGSNLTTVLESPVGGSIDAPSLTSLKRATLSVDNSRSVQTGVLTTIDGSRFWVRGGKTFDSVSDSDYYSENYFGAGDFFLADGAGSLLNLSSLKTVSFDQDLGGSPVYTIAARNGGVVDLSEVTTIVGARGGDILQLEASSGGSLLLGKLHAIDGNRNVQITSDGTSISLPMLHSIQGAVLFDLADGQTLDLPQLTTIDGAGSNATTLLRSAPHGSINVANLTSMQRATLVLAANESVTTGVLTNINGSRIQLRDGQTFSNVSATAYSSDSYFGEGDFFLADGFGTELDLSSIASLNFDQDFGGAPICTIAARHGGVVDLSGVTNIVGGRGGDTLRLEATGGGLLRLDKLASISGNRNVRITSDGTAISLDKLQSIEGAVLFELAAGQTLHLPELTFLDGAGSNLSTILEAPDGGSISAPLLTIVRRTELNLAATQLIELGTLTDIHGSRIHVTDGQSFSAAATSYDSLDYFGAGDVFSAQGAGSSLQLPALASINFDQDFGGIPVYTIAARESGVIDLSGLTSVVGSRGGDFLEFRAETGGTIDLTSLSTVAQNTRFSASSGGKLEFGLLNNFDAQLSATDLGSELVFKEGILMGPETTLVVHNGAEVLIRGGYQFEQNVEADLNLDAAILRFTGAGGQQMEVGGADSGVGGFTSGNFGIGQLVIGTTTQRTSVDLIDVINNGNRGGNGEAESLYLFGLGGPPGLRILKNSALVLNGIDVYAWDPVKGSQVHLNSLFEPGELRIPYDDGYLQLAPLDFQWANNAGGDFNVGENWSDGLVPLGSDSAVWNLGSVAGYAVQFGTHVAIDSAIIKSDRVTFDLAGFQLSLAAPHATAGLVVAQDAGDDANLTVINGDVTARDVRVAAAAGSQGTLEVGPSGYLEVNGDLILGSGAGTLRVTSTGQLAVSDEVIVSGDGRLEGIGLTAGLVSNQMGTIAPGITAGIMQLEADVLQHAGGTLEIELGGRDNSNLLAPQFDQLAVHGAADLAGALTINVIDSGMGLFDPADGDVFEIVTSSEGLATSFSSFDVPVLTGESWLLRQTDNSLFLRVAANLADFDEDGDIDGRDFLTWQRGFGLLSGATKADGDSDGDGDVDGLDFETWHEQYGYQVIGSPLAFTTVPEPPATTLILICLLVSSHFAHTRLPLKHRQGKIVEKQR